MGRTPRGQTRAKVLAYVRERLLAGMPPTVREVQRALGFRAAQTARQHLEALVAEGSLAALRGVSRGYRLPESGERNEVPPPTRLGHSPPPTLRDPPQPRRVGSLGWIPLLGRVQAGRLSFATEDLEGYLPSDSVEVTSRDEVSSDPEHFALRVAGESMTGAGIMPGDIVIVRRQDKARSGEIVVARVDDEATIKRLRLRKGRVELHAEHPDFPPILPENDVAILGRVIEVRRRY